MVAVNTISQLCLAQSVHVPVQLAEWRSITDRRTYCDRRRENHIPCLPRDTDIVYLYRAAFVEFIIPFLRDIESDIEIPMAAQGVSFTGETIMLDGDTMLESGIQFADQQFAF